MSHTFDANTCITDLFDQINQLLTNYSHQGFQALVSVVQVPLGAAIVLYIVLMGTAITQGWVELSMKNFVKSALTIGLVYTFSMHWDWFNTYFISLVTSTIDVVSKATMNMGDPTIMHGKDGVGNALQLALNRAVTLANEFFKDAGLTNISPILIGAILLFLNIALIALGATLLIISKVFLSVLFAFAPMMIVFTLFHPTRSFFDRWLGQITGNAMAIIFISATMGFIISLLNSALPAHPTEGPTLTSAIAPIIVAIVGIILLLKAADIGRDIGGAPASIAEKMALSVAVGSTLGGFSLGASLLRGTMKSPGAIRNAYGAGKEALSNTYEMGKNVASKARQLLRR